MKLLVLFGQLKNSYPGQYAPDALACMTEYAHSDNPAYLEGEHAKALESKAYESVALVALNVDGARIDELLSPKPAEIPATIID